MRTGTLFATKFLNIEYIAFVDGDLQHDPSDLLNLYYYLINKELNVVGKKF